MHNQKGISLVQVLLVSALLGGVSLGVLRVQQRGIDDVNRREFRQEMNEVMKRVNQIINAQFSCTANLKGTPLQNDVYISGLYACSLDSDSPDDCRDTPSLKINPVQLDRPNNSLIVDSMKVSSCSTFAKLDQNNDGVIGSGDVVVFLQIIGSTSENGDFNCDGIVDNDDLDILMNNNGNAADEVIFQAELEVEFTPTKKGFGGPIRKKRVFNYKVSSTAPSSISQCVNNAPAEIKDIIQESFCNGPTLFWSAAEQRCRRVFLARQDEIKCPAGESLVGFRLNPEILVMEPVCEMQTLQEEWVFIPANYGDMGLPAFSVMKYEAKGWQDENNDGIIQPSEISPEGKNEGSALDSVAYKPVSVAPGKPYRFITQTTAISECESLGANYALISNPQWMAIARGIEAMPANWSGGNVGDGCLSRGNMRSSDGCGYNAGDIDSGSDRDPKASHLISAGVTIFDIAGNVNELVQWSTTSLYSDVCSDASTNCGTNCTEGGEFSDINCPALVDDDYKPATSNVNSSNGVGYYFGSTGTGGFPRGMAWRGGSYPGWADRDFKGVFAIEFRSHTISSTSAGFRCVNNSP